MYKNTDLIECPSCDGEGCDECDHTGQVETWEHDETVKEWAGEHKYDSHKNGDYR